MTTQPRTPRFLEHTPPGQSVHKVGFLRSLTPLPPLPMEDAPAAAAPVVHAQTSAPFVPPPVPPPPPPEPSLKELERWTLGLAQAVDAFRQHSGRLAEETRSDALEIGFQVARKILEREIAADISSLVSLVRSAVRKAGESRTLQVRVAIPVHEALEAALDAQRFGESWMARVEVVPDPTLQPGDVMVETDFGVVDGMLETRLRESRNAVAAALHIGKP